MSVAVAPGGLHCCSCHIDVPASERTLHYKLEWHRYNVKRKCAGMGPIPRQLFESKLAALVSSRPKHGHHLAESSTILKRRPSVTQKPGEKDASSSSVSGDTSPSKKIQMKKEQKKRARKLTIVFECKVCNKKFKSKGQCQSHLKQKKHLRKCAELGISAASLSAAASAQHTTDQTDSLDALAAQKEADPKYEAAEDEDVPMDDHEEGRDLDDSLNEEESQSAEEDADGLMDDLREGQNEMDVMEEEDDHEDGDGAAEAPEEGNDDNDDGHKERDVAAPPLKSLKDIVEIKTVDSTHKRLPHWSRRKENSLSSMLSNHEDLFSRKHVGFDNLEDCFIHMFERHSFMIPLANRLRDHVGLVEIYKVLHECIYERRQCIWCWKGFKAVPSLLRHMHSMDHCKMNIDSGPHVLWQTRAEKNRARKERKRERQRLIQAAAEMDRMEQQQNGADHRSDVERMDDSALLEIAESVVSSSKYQSAEKDEEEETGTSPFSDLYDFEAINDEWSSSDDENDDDDDGDSTVGMMDVDSAILDSLELTDLSSGMDDDEDKDDDCESAMLDGLDRDRALMLRIEDSAGDMSSHVVSTSVRGRRTVTEVNSAGELILSDGHVIGHKNYRNVYRQARALRHDRGLRKGVLSSVTPSTKSREQEIAEMNNPVRGLKVLKSVQEMKMGNTTLKAMRQARKDIRKLYERRDAKYIKYQQRSHKNNNDHIRSQNPMLN